MQSLRVAFEHSHRSIAIFSASPDADPRKTISVQSLSEWWKCFDDPILEEIVERAATNNLSFAIAQERLVQARWSYVGSFGSLLPAIGLGGSLSKNEWHKDTATAKAGGSDIHRNAYHGGFDMTWEIDVFGGNRRALKRFASKLPCRSWLKLFYLLFVKGGILDGPAGWLYCRMQAHYEFMCATILEDLKRSRL